MATRREKPRSKAVALRYHQERESAPRVVAKGEGLIAQKIREVAEAHGVPIQRDDDLVELLAQVELDREIPVELYGAVAEILSWIYRANEDMRRQVLGTS
ncbi:MAG: flagellar biosynthesis protein FlhB [Chitinivibrionales bacterium]|nr:flagellar biosynthesis protein FlhB [Chitinivibrionales bacterium]MBD3394291.1 flagellar biosynthesis protein FlhB [Chitinivibrionales bacterium]